MAEIRLLDSSVINLIAAGEVVDRPASAVKELVENSLDAGATQISVEIRRGGLELIRVSDNGCGMTADNARRAFLKHATSKIRTEDDLNAIGTLGFRGEALAAISAVSRIVLTTKQADATVGTRFEVAEGHITSEEECGCPDGSSFSVHNLFFNTPARLKFMKSEPAETGAVQSVMERLALSHPSVSFRFTANGNERLHTPGHGNLVETVFAVFGKEFAEMSLSADTASADIRVFGIVGKPVYSKPNRSRQIFFLNGRYVRSAVLTAGLENAYQNKMLIGRVPVCVLFVEMPATAVDVNVHPGKLEVKFADENAVAYAVRKAAERALQSDNGIVEMKVSVPVEPMAIPKTPLKTVSQKIVVPSDMPKKPSAQTPPKPSASATPAVEQTPQVSRPGISAKPIEQVCKNEIIAEKSGWTISVPMPSTEAKSPAASKPVLRDTASVRPVVQQPAPPHVISVIPPTPTVLSAPSEKKESQSAPSSAVPATTTEEPVLFKAAPPFRLVGEAFDCYILVEKGEELLFVDKHALHERMNFERLRKSEIPSQSLLQPVVMHLGIDENRILSEHADFLSRFGFILESFGDDLLIREIPALIDGEQAEPLLQQFADALAFGKTDSLMDRFYYDLACKASIRSGSKSTLPELETLISEYFSREAELQYCPHGRPIVFSLTEKSIEKQFKRVK